MAKEIISKLSRRERQIMDIVYRKGMASAAEIQEHLPSAPGYSAVRALLRVLEDKGYLKHKKILLILLILSRTFCPFQENAGHPAYDIK